MAYRNIAIEVSVSEEEYRRLCKLREIVDAKWTDCPFGTPGKLLESMVNTGFKHTLARRFRYWEEMFQVSLDEAEDGKEI